jgi:hypothetical protein
MVRYPFDVLRAVSQVEPLTMNGNSNNAKANLPFTLRYRRVSDISWAMLENAKRTY